MTDPSAAQAPLFDDNPAVIDLLGFGAVADAVVRVLAADGLDPVTVGVQGGWGGGKSTVLNLVAERLEKRMDTLVIRVDPWEFEDSQDVRGTLIALVLDGLHKRVTDREIEVHGRRRAEVTKHLKRLRARIAWGRAAKVLATGAISLVPGGGAVAMLGELATALMPPDPDDVAADDDGTGPQNMAGFREDFKALVAQDLGVVKVAVLVDDLDRCLPAAAVGTLEAIKLFLSVPKMAFVLAADEDLVRASIDKHLGGLANGEFANRYTEKIVQLPISLPRLSEHDTEAFISLLLASPKLDEAEQAALLESVRTRRRVGAAPYVLAEAVPGLAPAGLTLAATVAAGLAADTHLTPRAVKRFLNSLAIRELLARDAGAELELPVLVRLYLLELRHLSEFKVLAALPPEGRRDLLTAWEAWGRQDQHAEQPENIGETTRAWAASLPSLVDRVDDISRYLTVAATLRSEMRVGGSLDAAQLQRVTGLLSESDADRRATVADVVDLHAPQQEALVAAVGDQLSRVTNVHSALDSLMRIARAVPRLIDVVSEQLLRPTVMRRFEPQHVPLLAELPRVLAAVSTADGIDERVKRAVAEVAG